MNYEVDVIIPNYGETTRLRRAVHSALNQLYTKPTIWIADNGHSIEVTDFIRNEIETLSDQIRILILDNPMHPGFARNEILKQSNNPWVAFLDADDWWEENHIDTAIKFMMETGTDFISSDAYLHRFEGNHSGPSTYFGAKKLRSRWSFLLNNPNINSTIVTTRNLIEKLDTYPNGSLTRGVEDFAFTLRACTVGLHARTPNVTAHYSFSDFSLSSHIDKFSKIFAYIDYLKWLRKTNSQLKFNIRIIRILVLFQIIREIIKI